MFKKLLQLIGFMPKNSRYIEENVIEIKTITTTDVNEIATEFKAAAAAEVATEFKAAAAEVATEFMAAAAEVATDAADIAKTTRAARKTKDTTTEKKPRKSKKKTN